MTQVLYGKRLGKNGELRVGCSAVIFDSIGQKTLLTRRADNGLWCLPGGHMEPGESAEECCIREIFEETGLKVRVKRLVGVYSNPDQLVIYPDGNKAHFVILSFEAEIMDGQLGLSDETTEVGFFTIEEIESMLIHDLHKDRILDALENLSEAFIR
jgi:ADP-ribose pyrophosphatase YjhB (NUDIX family)